MSNRTGLQEAAFAALRIVAGVLFMVHGTQKLLGIPPMPPGMHIDIASQVGVGGIIELVCGALIALGLGTRLAAFLASGMMAVAYFQFHWKLQFGNWLFLPSVNQGEAAVLYCFIFLLFAAAGAGPYSLDAKRGAG
jgi:putative oxidoreductase